MMRIKFYVLPGILLFAVMTAHADIAIINDFGQSTPKIESVMNAINNRPRKRLGFRTPLEVAKSFSPGFF